MGRLSTAHFGKSDWQFSLEGTLPSMSQMSVCIRRQQVSGYLQRAESIWTHFVQELGMFLGTKAVSSFHSAYFTRYFALSTVISPPIRQSTSNEIKIFVILSWKEVRELETNRLIWPISNVHKRLSGTSFLTLNIIGFTIFGSLAILTIVLIMVLRQIWSLHQSRNFERWSVSFSLEDSMCCSSSTSSRETYGRRKLCANGQREFMISRPLSKLKGMLGSNTTQ